MSDPGRACFARLLRQRGIPYYDEAHLEEWIAVQETRPDFAARPLGFPPFLAQVAAPLPLGPGGVAEIGGAPPGTGAKALGRLVRHAAVQLRPYRRVGLAAIVVLGQAGLRGAPLEAEALVPLVAALEDRRPYVSALLLNLPKRACGRGGAADQEPLLRARVLHNPAAIVPLHLGIFAEPEDEHFLRMGDRWVDVRTGAPLLSAEAPPASPPPE